MSNEQFFLTFICKEFEDLETKEPTIENGIKIYKFRHFWPDGKSSVYKIRFNSVGGFIDYEEIEKPEYDRYGE